MRAYELYLQAQKQASLTGHLGTAAVGAAAGAMTNALGGDKNDSLGSRALKGAVAGGVGGALLGGGVTGTAVQAAIGGGIAGVSLPSLVAPQSRAKQANLFINAERSPLLSEKLLQLRARQAKALHGVEIFDAATMSKWNPFRSPVGAVSQAFGGGATMRVERVPNPISKLLGRTQAAQPRTQIYIAKDLPVGERAITFHHELDEADFMRQKELVAPNLIQQIQNRSAQQKGLPQPHRNSAQEKMFGAVVEPRIPGAHDPMRMPIAHADPGVILRESNRVGHQLAPEHATDWHHRRKSVTGDAALMTAPYGKWMPEGGREFTSQQRVMLTRQTPALNSRGQQARIQAYLDAGFTNAAAASMRPHEVYATRKRLDKQFGKQLGKSENRDLDTRMLRAITGNYVPKS